MADRQPLAHHQPQPEEGRQLRAPEVAVHTRRGVQERVLEHVGGVDPALEPRSPSAARPCGAADPGGAGKGP